MADILAIGEMLIDFTENIVENGEINYKRNAGGAPANVAVMAAKLGVSSGFIGKVGKDMFGKYLKQVLVDNGVETNGLILDSDYSTTLAFVGKNEDGDRDFVFYRQNGADANLNYKEIRLKRCIKDYPNVEVDTYEGLLAEYAKEKGKIISYDPNYRDRLWKSRDEAVRAMQSVLPLVDIIKVSEDELQILTDLGNMIPAIAKVLNTGVKIICITQGAKGCVIATKKGIETIRTFKVDTIDTLGAGDSFFGAFLSQIVKSGKTIDELTMADLKNFAVYANACGSLSSTKQGAIPAMPDDEAIKALIANGSILQ